MGMPRTIVTTLAILCVGLGLSACGGDSDGSADDASADLVAQVNTICDEWQESLDARGEFPVEGFDPENASADDLPAVGDYLTKSTAAGETALTSLRELDPPDEARSDLDDLVGAFEAQLESASRQTRAALDGDVAGFTATLDEAGPTTEAVDDAAEALGASSCSSGS
jgi:hypothetical protein